MNLFHGDCLEVMKGMEAESVDLTVTSPPYDNLRRYAAMPLDKFKLIAGQLARVTKPGGVIVWVVADATVNGSETGSSFRQALYFRDECGLRLHDTMIYHAEKPPLTHNRYEQKFEYMFVISKGRPSVFNGLREASVNAGKRQYGTFRHDGENLEPKHKPGLVAETKLRGNVWKYRVGGTNVGHPAIFPESLANDHIQSWSNPGDVVFDPFMGSGTTGIAASILGRKFIGIEKDEKYFAIASQRIAQTHQLSK